MAIRWKRNQEIEYQGGKWTLIDYLYRDYAYGYEVWSAKNSVGETWKVYLK